MRPAWTLFDYGVGNIHSLRKALQAAGAVTRLTDHTADLKEAEIVVLPGVGAFGHVMHRLAPVADALRERHLDARPIFGVCIGQQVLYEGSDEAPGVAGLGILPGRVERLPAHAGKVPHMGWNTVTAPEWPAAHEAHVYYVHSYAAPPGPHTIATTTYGATFSAAERAGSTMAVQFHPEKSSLDGRRILEETVARVEAIA